MLLSNAPGKLPLPFASAGGKNVIPVASQVGITAGAASLTDGFPPLTRTPIAAGGIPPSGLDMNGILYEMSNIIRWANAGAGYPYDATFATDVNVGGYPKGARLLRADGTGYWLNIADNNTTDPDGATPADWVPDVQYGIAALTMTSANHTLAPDEYGRRVIIITGALTANLNLIFPTIIGSWEIINKTTGAFLISAKTASGLAVNIPQGYVSKIVNDGLDMSSELSVLSDNSNMSLGVSLIGGAGRVVTSMSALRALPSTGAPKVFVTGYRNDSTFLGGGSYSYVAADTATGALFTGSITGTVLTVSAVTNGALSVNQQINWSGSNGSVFIASNGTGTGGAGTYNLNKAPGAIASQTMTADDGGSKIVALDGGRWYRKWSTSPSIADFGAIPDYNPTTRTGTDNRYACQNAIDFASTIYSTSADYSQNIAKKLTAPSGVFLIGGQGLGLTTSRVNSTYTRDGLVFEGDSFATVFVGQTGNLAVMDVTGSQWLRLEKFWIYARDGDANTSAVGVFDGIATANQQSQNKRFNIRIALGTSTTVNGGLGTVAFWGFGSEENTHAQPYYSAIRAAIFTTDNSGTAHPAYPQGTAYPHSALMSSHSLGLVTMEGEAFLQSVATTGTISPLALYNVNTLKAPNLYLNSQSITSGAAAIDVPYGALSNSVIHGTIEGCGIGLRVGAIVDSSEISLTYGGVNNAAQNSDPAIELIHGAQGGIQNSELVVDLLANTTRPIWGIGSAPAAGTQITCKLQNVICCANASTIGQWMLPKTLLYTSSNVDLQGFKGAPSTNYKIVGNNVHEIDISAVLVYNATGPIYNVPVLQLALPTVVAANSLAGYAIKIEGSFQSGFSNGTNAVVAWVDAWLSFCINPGGTHVTPVVSGSITNKAAANSAANDITGITVTDTDLTTYFNIILNPVMGGTAAEPTYFQGKATLVWRGHVSEAPYLALP